MKKKLLFILIACLLFQSFIIGFNQQNYFDYNNSLPKAADDDYESNDSYDQATPLQNISYYDLFILQDIDWFVLSLNVGDNITLMIQTDSDLADMEINFYESDGDTPVAGSIIDGAGLMWMIAVSNLPETGNYYFSLLPLGDPFAYSFMITDEFDDIYEENDIIQDAVEVTGGFGYDLLYSLDDDWYKIYLEAGESLELIYAYMITDSFEFNLIGTDGTTILEPSTEESEEDMGAIYKSLSFSESVIDTTGYYYIEVTSDTPTIYIIEFYINENNLLFEDMSTYLYYYQFGENNYQLGWDYLDDAEFYYIFRESSEITSVDGLTPFTNTGYRYYELSTEENGNYYYVVMGNNGTHNSSISNCVNITTKSFEELSLYISLYLYDEYAQLFWSRITTAEYYYIFRENSEITTVDGLTPIATLAGSVNNYQDLITEFGNFYYVVIANNGTHNSSISNCVSYEIFPFNENVPELDPIIPNIDEDGTILLEWDSIYNASLYYIFRETSPITTIDGLTPIADKTYSNYIDQISENGTYYYVIVANNGTVNSSISNCESVNCSITPFYDQAPYIQFISTDYDQSGTILVHWTELNDAIEYYIYRDIIPITDIGGLAPIATETAYMFEDQVYENGTYYYVVVANNGSTNSTPSSCKSIEISIIPFYERVPYFYVYPSRSYEGEFTLEWQCLPFAVEYYIFRETTYIIDIDGLIPIATIPDDGGYWMNYEDTISESGTYYYVIVANDGSVNSQISECRDVDFIPPYVYPFHELAPILFEIDPNNSTTGIINIEWEKVVSSVNYYIYRETSPIYSIDGLTPIDSAFDFYNQSWLETLNFVDNITESGTYYYVVVAYNGDIYSSISNCESVEVILERETIKISGFDILTFGLVISCTASIIIVSIRKRRNSRNTSM